MQAARANRWALSALSLVLLASECLAAQVHAGASDEVDFARDVRPILAGRCYTCHGPDEATREARLRLDKLSVLADSELVNPGAPEGSELYLRLVEEDPDYRMPPPASGASLSEAEVATLRRWIEQGAETSGHWAYEPFHQVRVPEVEDGSWPLNEIDRFVLAELEERGLAPSPEADRRTLLRRASLDLVGMVPTPEQVGRFLADTEPGAYERAVDRLLDSTQYAERWARHWLDLARYADSHGYTIDGGRSMWPYRDWVITAIDQDMPFDRFTIEQLAGDLLPEPTNAQLVATGFHRNTQINQEGGAKDEENRVNAVIDRVDTTGAVWLGSTLACARCHSHKYDPISQTEYFQLFAFFNQTEDGGVSSEPSVLVTDEKTAPALAEFEDREDELQRALQEAESDALSGWTAWAPARATGSNGPELRLGEDLSIRSIGHNPQTSDYVLEGSAPLARVAALRIEALPDLRLPHHGPGRSGSGNFVLERVRLFARPAGGGDFEELELEGAEASYSQGFGPEGGSLYPVTAALEDEPKKGWAVSPRFGQPHVAHFELSQPLPEGDWELRLVLEQNWGTNHVLGRFRVAFAGASDEAGAPVVPVAWSEAWQRVEEHARSRPRLPSTLVMRERATPRPNHVFVRGDFLSPGASVTPGFPSAMQSFEWSGPPATRLDLARWLVDPRNALAHRVTVNRWWQRYFGAGLVPTERDFGVRGAEPSHPELLEWLAQELVARGFSMKAMHRLMVTSATYRQSSRRRPELDELDPRNRLLARQSRLRVEAEVIRDSALRASGLLTDAVGGPPVQPPQPEGVFAFTQSRKSWEAAQSADRFRRTLYTRLWRSSTYPFLLTFDAPAADVACTRRGRSSTPLQALTLANDPMILELAEGLGAELRAAQAAGGDGIAQGFERCLARPPSESEHRLLAEHRSQVAERELAAGSTEERAERHSWTALSRVLLNLDEFLTRE